MNDLILTAQKIKDLKIQGARSIAVASLNSVKKYNRGFKSPNKNHYLKGLRQGIKILTLARPTEPLTYNLLNYLNDSLKKNPGASLNNLKIAVNRSLDRFLKMLDGGQQKIIKAGQPIIKNHQNIFTHCHSSTVEDILKKAWQNKKRFKIFNTETRPMFQGRITAKNLRKAGIPVTLVADSAAAFLISEHSGKKLMMDLVLLGADAVLPDGSVINKIGSFGIGLTAFTQKVPLYVVTTLLKYDTDGIIPIEIRPTEEIWPNKPKGLKIINFAFDKIPAKYIKGIICEFGIIKPREVKELVKKHYPWIK